MNQRLHAIVWYLFIIWLPNLMRAMHVYLTSLNGVCVCVMRVEVQIVFFGVHVKLVLQKFQAAPCYAKNSS